MRRQLYGEFLDELDRRLMVVGGYEDADLPVLHWGPDLPSDEAADAQVVMQDLSSGIISKATAAQKRGYTWAGEQGEEAKIAQEATAANATNANIGGLILRGFNRGQ